MQMSWRGFFRAWTVLAIIWVTCFGWREYSVARWIDPALHSGGKCWDRLAKWTDGKAFDDWELLFSDAEPGSVPTANDRWRESIGQKLRACEDARPLVERWSGWVADNFSSVEDSFLLILLPPFGLLLFSYCVGWVAKGFRPVR
jgi:hypothetical protein